MGRQVSVSYLAHPVPGSPFAVGILHGKIDGQRSSVPPLSIYLSTYLSTYLSIYLSIYLPIYLSIYIYP